MQRSAASLGVPPSGPGASEDDKDAFYAIAGARIRGEHGPLHGSDVMAMRQILETGDESTTQDADAPVGAAAVQVLAAVFFGIQEVGADAFAEGMDAASWFPEINVESWCEAARDYEDADGSLADALRLPGPFDMVRRASGDQLRRARETFLGLASVGALYFSHGMLMPDSPGQQRIRRRIDDLGIATLVLSHARGLISQTAFAHSLAGCLYPVSRQLYELIKQEITDGLDLLDGTGEAQGREQEFGSEWLAAIKAAGERAPAGGC